MSKMSELDQKLDEFAEQLFEYFKDTYGPLTEQLIADLLDHTNLEDEVRARMCELL